MILWIEGKAFSPDQISEIEKLEVSNDWLMSVISFLKFWYSDARYFEAKTSGSTSEPKTIQISRDQLIISAESTIRHFAFSSETDGLVSCISARHVGGFMVLVRGILANLDVWILPPKSSPLPISDQMLMARKWFISVVPIQLENMSVLPELLHASSFWKGILVGGAGLSSTQQKSATAFQCPVFQSYGMTETVSHIAVRQISTTVDFPFEVFPGTVIRKNELECLEIKSKLTNNQWLTTNDMVDIESDSTFRFLGRIDDVINSGGLKINPIQVSTAIDKFLKNPAILFHVLGIPDTVYGQKVVVIFQETPSLMSLEYNNLMQFLKSEIGSPYLPKAIFQMEGIPLLPNLKLDKQLLINLLQEKKPVWEASNPKS